MKFPRTIYVYHTESEVGEDWMAAEASPSDCVTPGHKQVVGQYELVNIVEVEKVVETTTKVTIREVPNGLADPDDVHGQDDREPGPGDDPGA